MKNLKLLVKRQPVFNSGQTRGFTIIEVMIVLSIAALIMLIVFLAVPALQRSARNNQRDADAAKIAAAVNECLSNNNGTVSNCMPANNTSVQATNPATGTNPVVGTSGTLNISTIQQLTSVTLYGPGSALPAQPNTASVVILPGYVCNGSTPTTTNASANQFTVWYSKESANSGNSIAKCLGS